MSSHFGSPSSTPLHLARDSRWPYDVFLSFRGDDTRNNFTGHLYKRLAESGIRTFRDDRARDKPRSEEEAWQAIEGSKVSLVVLSENYASSTWCLDELIHILEYRRSKNQTVIPIFYNVNPSDVRNQIGKFGEAVIDNQSNLKIMRWREALMDAATLPGWHFSYWNEFRLMDRMVEEISYQLAHRTTLEGCQNLILFPRLAKLKSLQNFNLTDCKGVVNFPAEVLGKLESLSCISLSGTDIEQLPSGVLALEELYLAGCERLKTSPCSSHHLQYLWVLGKHVFPNTVNSKVLLTKWKISYDNYISVSELDLSGSNFVTLPGCFTEFVNLKELYLRGCRRLGEIQELPPRIKWLDLKDCISLQSISKFSNILNGDETQMVEWMDLSNCRRLCDTLVQMAKRSSILQTDQINSLVSLFFSCQSSSFDMVFPGNEVPKWFGWHKDLNKHHLSAHFPIEIPSNFKWENTGLTIFVVFDQIMDFSDVLWSFDISINGVKVAGSDCCIESTESDHVWLNYVPFNTVDMAPLGYTRPLPPFRCQVSISRGSCIKSCGVHLVMPPEEDICRTVSATDILRDPRCRFLESSGSEEVLQISKKLRSLEWKVWPEYSFEPLLEWIRTKLLKLKSPLGVGFQSWKNLTSVSFESCHFIKIFPDISGLPNLKSLNLNHCISLVELDDSVGESKNLVDLSLSGCHNLIMFPKRINLKSAKHINFKGCRMLQSLPEIMHDMECLTWLDLSGTAIKQLPSSIGYLRRLEELVLQECANLTNLPSNIYELQNLWCLDLQNCSNLVAFPEWSTESLQIKISHALLYLNLRGCKRLEEIPELPPKVERINVADCLQLKRFAKLSNILARKESEMIKCITMFNCQRLCDVLALEMAENGDLLLNEVTLCSLFLSCKQSEFDIVFPGSGVPKWFSRRKELLEIIDDCEFSFEIPPNLWNKGFAICAAVQHVNPEEKETMQQCSITAMININAGRIITRSFYFEAKDIESAHVWLCYIPFLKFVYHQSPPFTCKVSLEHISQGSMRCRSFGVHLVTPQDEDEDDDEDEDENDDDDDDDDELEESVGKN